MHCWPALAPRRSSSLVPDIATCCPWAAQHDRWAAYPNNPSCSFSPGDDCSQVRGLHGSKWQRLDLARTLRSSTRTGWTKALPARTGTLCCHVRHIHSHVTAHKQSAHYSA